MSLCTAKQYFSMLRLFSAGVFAFMVFFLMNAGAAAGSQALIMVEEVEGVVGETVTVPVKIKDSGGMAGGDVVVSYDPDIVELKDIEAGSVISDTIFMPNPAYGENTLKFLWAKAEKDPITEDGNVAFLSFLLKEPGESSLEIKELELLDVDLQGIPVDGESGRVVVLENGIGESDTDNGAAEIDPESDENDAVERHPDTGDGTTEEEVSPGTAVLSIADVSGAVGDTVAVEVIIENPGGMAGGNIVLSYDPDLVEPKDVKTGDLLSGLIPISNLEYSENSLSIAWFGLTGKTSDGVIAEISFLIKEEGRSDLQLTELGLVDAEGEDITVEAVNGSIVSGEEGTSVPGVTDTNNWYIYILGIVVIIAVGIGLFFLIKSNKTKRYNGHV